MYGTTFDDDDNDRLNDVTTAAIMRRGQSGVPINITIRTPGPEAVPGLAAGSVGRAPDGVVNGAPYYSLESRGGQTAAGHKTGCGCGACGSKQLSVIGSAHALADHFAKRAAAALGSSGQQTMAKSLSEPWGLVRVAQDLPLGRDGKRDLSKFHEMIKLLDGRVDEQDAKLLGAKQQLVAGLHDRQTDRDTLAKFVAGNAALDTTGILPPQMRGQIHELRAQLQTAAMVMRAGYAHADAPDYKERVEAQRTALHALGNNPAYRAFSTSLRLLEESKHSLQCGVADSYRGAAREVSAPYARGMDKRGARPDQRSLGIQAPYADPD